MTRVTLLLPILLLCACAGPAPEPTYYLLRPAALPQSSTMPPSSEYSLGRVDVAPYINQAGLMLETGDGQVRPAALHLWAEPVNAGIHAYLSQEISRLYGKDLMPGAQTTKSIGVRIDQLHGTQDGDAILLAYWWITQDEMLSASGRFAGTQPLQASGYHALAAAERQLLAQLAAEVVAAMTTSVTEGVTGN